MYVTHQVSFYQVAAMPLITVRQTVDPYVDDIQYIASREIPLEPDGSLSMSKIGFGRPGDKFVIVSRETELPIGLEQPDNAPPLVSTVYPTSDIIEPYFIKIMASRESGPHPILTVVEIRDDASGSKRHQGRMDARERDKHIAYLKGLVTHAWNWVTPLFPSVHSNQVASMGSQRQHPDSISTTPEDLRSGSTGSDSIASTYVGPGANTSRLVHRHPTATVVD